MTAAEQTLVYRLLLYKHRYWRDAIEKRFPPDAALDRVDTSTLLQEVRDYVVKEAMREAEYQCERYRYMFEPPKWEPPENVVWYHPEERPGGVRGDTL